MMIQQEPLPDYAGLDPFAYNKDGWDVCKEAIEFDKELKKISVGVIDCSAAGTSLSRIRYILVPLFQVPFTEAVKRDADIPTAAIGMITESGEAEKVLQVVLALEFMRNTNWIMHATRDLGAHVNCVDQSSLAAHGWMEWGSKDR